MKQTVEYNITEAALSELKNTCDFAPNYETKKGAEASRLVIKECREMRSGIEKHRKELKSDALAYGKLVDSEAKRITATIIDCEAPHKEAKEEFESREQKRVEIINMNISDLTVSYDAMIDADIWVVSELLLKISTIKIDGSYQEFQEKAQETKGRSVELLDRLITQKKAEIEAKAEQQRLEQERREFEAEKLAIKTAENERLRLAAEEKEKEHQEELRKEREEIAAKQAIIDKENAEKHRLIAEENKRKQDAIDAQRERDAAIAQEKARVELERVELEAKQAKSAAVERLALLDSVQGMNEAVSVQDSIIIQSYGNKYKVAIKITLGDEA